MLTLFTIPKPFQGHIGMIQRNATQSWLQLQRACEIVLVGDEGGTGLCFDQSYGFGACYIRHFWEIGDETDANGC